MTSHPLDPDPTRPAENGVYFVGDDDLARLAARAVRGELAVLRIDLAQCRDKARVLDRFASALNFPADFGRNWDALADCLRDPAWHPAWGHVLLIEHAAPLRQGTRSVFDMLLGVLDDAATFAQDADRPFFAFIALPDHEHPTHA